MSNIDFQNGFLCGMATRGMITNGVTYQRFIELNVFDGYIIKKQLALTDSAESIIDTNNDRVIVDNLILSSLTITDGSEVVLV